MFRVTWHSLQLVRNPTLWRAGLIPVGQILAGKGTLIPSQSLPFEVRRWGPQAVSLLIVLSLLNVPYWIQTTGSTGRGIRKYFGHQTMLFLMQ